MRWIRGRQKGFTLIEMLVAIPLTALIALGASGAIVQLLQSHKISAQNMAIRQVQTAGHWVSGDGVQSQSVEISDNINDPDGFLTLEYVAYWTENITDKSSVSVTETHTITYTLVTPAGGGSLRELEREDAWTRTAVTRASSGQSSSTVTSGTDMPVVARFLNPALMSCVWDDAAAETEFEFTVAANVGMKTETRTYEVRPRPGG